MTKKITIAPTRGLPEKSIRKLKLYKTAKLNSTGEYVSIKYNGEHSKGSIFEILTIQGKKSLVLEKELSEFVL